MRLLSRLGYEGQIVLFNGTNSDADLQSDLPGVEGRVTRAATSSPGRPLPTCARPWSSDFRTTAKIMIATEAAAEGINLQFCSMVVNYDLPWNPQRIEQRIGRCHRYGQQHDVVVINFLNQANAADLRVFELLDEKFRLFSGVFGASDEVLGAIEAGVDFERRIVDIYQDCRTTEAINAEFEQLAARPRRRRSPRRWTAPGGSCWNTSTPRSMTGCGSASQRARSSSTRQPSSSGGSQRTSSTTTPTFDPADRSFSLDNCAHTSRPTSSSVATGSVVTRTRTAHRYRPQHPLALAVLDAAAELDDAMRRADASTTRAGPVRAEVTRTARRQDLGLHRCGSSPSSTASSPRTTCFSPAVTDDGQTSDRGPGPAALRCSGDRPACADRAKCRRPVVDAIATKRVEALLHDISARQGTWFDEEMDKLDRWAEDKRTGLKADLRSTTRRSRP